MRALVYQGQTLRLDNEYLQPEPLAGEALVRVKLTGVCNTDLEITRGYMQYQGVLGHEFIGVVERVYHQPGASDIRNLTGKRVVGDINAACHKADCTYCQRGMPTHCPERTTLGISGRDGAFADYLLLPTENLHIVPDGVSDEEAVFVEPLAANFEMLEQIHLKPTEMVMVLGDGKMGLLAAQVMALTGCHVILLGKHPEKLELARSWGIETRLATDPHPLRADVIVECTGAAQGLEQAAQLVRPRGTIFLKSTVVDKSEIALAPFVVDEIRVQGSRCGPFDPALRALARKTIHVRPMISRTFDLEEGLAAFEYAAQPGVLKVQLKVS